MKKEWLRVLPLGVPCISPTRWCVLISLERNNNPYERCSLTGSFTKCCILQNERGGLTAVLYTSVEKTDGRKNVAQGPRVH